MAIRLLMNSFVMFWIQKSHIVSDIEEIVHDLVQYGISPVSGIYRQGTCSDLVEDILVSHLSFFHHLNGYISPMEDPHQQSRLDYARLHAASDSYATSRPRRLNETREISPKGLSRLTQNIRGAQASVDREIRDEKLGVQKECARLLSSIIQGTKTKGLEIDWDDYLPAFDCNDDLRLEGPLLRKAERETLVRSTRPLSDDGRKVGPVHEYVRRLGEGDPPDGVRQGVDNVMTKIKNEKLHCSKDSLVLIQKTMGSTGFSLWELHKLWDTVKVGVSCWAPRAFVMLY